MPFLQGSKTFGRIFPTFSSFTERTTKTALKGDVLMSVRAPVGDINIAPTDMCIGRGLCSIRMKNGNQKYLFYLLKNNIHNILSKQNGTVFASVNRKDLESLELYVLNEEEQKSFGDFLALFDEKINLNDEINDNLSKQAEAIFEGVFAESMYGDKKISDFILPKRGRPLLSKDAIAGDVPVVAGGLEPAAFHNVANTVAPVITISASGANAGFVRLWNVPVWSSDSSFIDKTMTDMVYFWYLVLKTRQYEIYGAQTGSAQPHVYPQNVGSLPIDELDQVKAKEVNTLLTPLFEKIGENELENQRLASLRDSLLPRLLNGEINLAE